jgi:hypothetical protein
LNPLRGRHPLLWAAALVVVLAAAMAGLLLQRRHHGGRMLSVHVAGPHGLVAVGNGVVAALYSSGELVKIDDRGRIAYRVAVGARPTNPSLLDDVVWVPVIGSRALLGVQAQSGVVVHRYHGMYSAAVPGPGDAIYLPTWTDAPAHPTLWRGRSVTRLDPATGRVLWTRRFDGIVLNLATTTTHVWVPNFVSPSVAVLDATTGQTLQTIRLPGRAVAIAIGRRCAWLALDRGPLLRLDPRSGAIEGMTDLSAANVDYMQAADDGVWVSNYSSPADSDLVHVGCATGRVDARVATGGASQGLAVTGRYVWTADFGHDELLRMVKPS